MDHHDGAGERAVLTALYRTRITHLRRAPVHHYFEQRGYSWYVDIDDLPRLPRWLQPFARFEAVDHLFPPASGPDTLRRRVDAYLADRGVELPGGTITALMQARVLGYVFNPLTVFWCHDANGVLRHVIAEVHNTYGDRHCYLLRPDAGGHAGADKAFYVSPFFTVDGHYDIRCPEPGDTVDVSITLHRDGRPVFSARVAGARENAARSVLAQALRRPLTSHRVMALIRFEGLRLWLRGVPIVARPQPVTQESVR
jgi:DUF1365 family protein